MVGWLAATVQVTSSESVAGGTYFPPTDRYGRPGFKTLLTRIADAWANDKAALKSQGSKYLAAISAAVQEEGEILCSQSQASQLLLDAACNSALW